MRLYEKDAFNLTAEEDQLMLHLSAPYFTRKQLFVRKMKQFYYTLKGWII